MSQLLSSSAWLFIALVSLIATAGPLSQHKAGGEA